ncbi:hypothetical protein TSTA_063360 [Talaromyces stipitatus ATCC 10500]|uniref:Uncharacterized protein n=1 Tax=Talaromyces stipitatus (strain ATCC 10500 / CBS 375.48 / QM 6759 / NRRL 1006) TaxID=441959 RepID=B8LYC6_TALSN|nr:uncharacterized protein TSTA_063360 [Talaromyces stipitatus ATCC 10500]EED22855.1 hypothetical protein TSTA_063360 [Talaromyces stipitatus ATCC 10500]
MKYTSKTTGKELNVFCISNKTYKKFSDQGNAGMVCTSGIPELRRFCLSMAAEPRLLEAKDFLQSKLPSLLNSITFWTKSAPTPKSDHTPSVSQFFQDVKAKFLTRTDNKKLRADWINAAIIKAQDWVKEKSERSQI